MSSNVALTDRDFLNQLDSENLKNVLAQILILDRNEKPIRTIVGLISSGSISINGDSSVRRTANLTFVAEEIKNDLTDINHLLSINKKIKIMVGIENKINSDYDKIIWFNQGIYVLNDPSIQHSLSGVSISINCQDKMCLLNGTCGGNLPAPVTFGEYEQLNEDGTSTTIQQRLYDIIQTSVCNHGGENEANILISDIPLEIKQIVRYTGTTPLYFDTASGQYQIDKPDSIEEDRWTIYNYNEDIGYIYTDFVFPGELTTGLGENVTSVLDKIKAALGNYEYFYDVNGKFVFREIKNYLNNSYGIEDVGRASVTYNYTDLPLSDVEKGAIKDELNISYQQKKEIIERVLNSKLDKTEARIKINIESSFDSDRSYIVFVVKNDLWTSTDNEVSITNEANYNIDLSNSSKSVYTFSDGSNLINSFQNSITYSNIKNDFHIWGKNDKGYAIHYHLAIKEKPTEFRTYRVAFIYGKDEKPTGELKLLNVQPTRTAEIVDGTLILYGTMFSCFQGILSTPHQVTVKNNIISFPSSTLPDVEFVEYTPEDWRAELYLRGLEKKMKQQRPDIYEQELLDNFDSIYNFKEKAFKSDIVDKPNQLNYFLDYLKPSANLDDCSIDSIGIKTQTQQEDKINRIYDTDIPNLILINIDGDSAERDLITARCEKEGQSYSNVEQKVYKLFAIGSSGYSAQSTARSLIYQHTTYNESISISCIPIYYLQVNSRITVEDSSSNIHGDYIIKSISMPLAASGTMSITATKALERF